MTTTVVSESCNAQDEFLISVYKLGITPDVSDKLKSLRDEKSQLTDQQIVDLVVNTTGLNQPA